MSERKTWHVYHLVRETFIVGAANREEAFAEAKLRVTPSTKECYGALAYPEDADPFVKKVEPKPEL